MEIENKIVLLTGGASGLGFVCAKELLRNGAAHVAILDLSRSNGQVAVEKLEVEFGKERAIFIVCDVTKPEEFEAGFKKTIETFSGLDIVINNAGIANETNWEPMVATNLNGVIRGTILGLENMGKYKGGNGGTIVNIASIAGILPYEFCPIYAATKHGVIGFSRSLGKPYCYEKTGVRILVICPGFMDTPMITEAIKPDSGLIERKLFDTAMKVWGSQKAESVASELMSIVRTGQHGSVWVINGGKSVEFSLPDNLSIKTFANE